MAIIHKPCMLLAIHKIVTVYFHAGIVLTLIEIIGIFVGGVATAIAGIIAIIIMAVIIKMRCCIKQGYDPPRVSFCSSLY